MQIRRAVLRVLICVTCFGMAHQAARADDFLDPDKAFVLRAQVHDDKTIKLTYVIAPGYYLYRERLKVQSSDAILGKVQSPAGQTKFDPNLNKKVELYRGSVDVLVPVTKASGDFSLQVTSQGCAEAGLCYPPQKVQLRAALSAYGGAAHVEVLRAATR